MRLARFELAQTFAQLANWVDGVLKKMHRDHDEQKGLRVGE